MGLRHRNRRNHQLTFRSLLDQIAWVVAIFTEYDTEAPMPTFPMNDAVISCGGIGQEVYTAALAKFLPFFVHHIEGVAVVETFKSNKIVSEHEAEVPTKLTIPDDLVSRFHREDRVVPLTHMLRPRRVWIQLKPLGDLRERLLPKFTDRQ